MTRADRPDPANPASAAALRIAIQGALAGDGSAVLPAPLVHDGPLPAGTALVVRTSGSTGEPREVALSGAALVASARATHERLGGDGQWLLTLPASHIAGLQVILRSVVADTELVTADPEERFSPTSFAAAAARMTAERRYVSLVPTQLHRLVDPSPSPAPSGVPGAQAGLNALRRFDAVLLGGAAASPALLARAREAGVRVVTTYGMTETSGGCVYDGVPLAGVQVRMIGGTDQSGVIEIGGPTLATAYLGDDALTAATFRTDTDGSRWMRTNDLGTLSEDGTLTVHGRADDVIVTGGVNVAPAAVEAILTGLDGVGEACVVGVPDAEWGHAVVAVVTSPQASGSLDRRPDAEERLLAEARRAVTATLGAPSAPRRVRLVAELPQRGPGKVDRAAVLALATSHAHH